MIAGDRVAHPAGPRFADSYRPCTRTVLATSRRASSLQCSCARVSALSSNVSSTFRGNAVPSQILYTRRAGGSCRQVTRMGNQATTGPFAPIVRVAREVVGKKKFNMIRGKAIALHSQVIKTFCSNVGADRKVAQGVIRLAKKNGEKLGFLA